MDSTLVLTGTVISIVLQVLLFALVIWLVSKLNLGLTVKGFGTAILTALTISVVTAIVNLLVGVLFTSLGWALPSGVMLSLLILVLAVIVLLVSDRILPGMEVKGITGAVAAAVMMGVTAWLITMILAALQFTV